MWRENAASKPRDIRTPRHSDLHYLKDLKGSEDFQNKVFLSQGDDVKSALLVLAGANSRLLSQTPHDVLQVKQPYFNDTVHFNIQIILARRRDARPPENISTLFPPALHLLQ